MRGNTAVEPSETRLLRFTIRLVQDPRDLEKAVSIRHAAYHRHVPELAAKLTAPEPYDSEPGVSILLAESKGDGSPVGTMRIHTNRFKPLPLEASIDLPEHLQKQKLAEFNRLGVARGAVGMLAKTMLFKAAYLHCFELGFDFMVVAARAPVDRQYEAIMFTDVYPERGFIPLAHCAHLPHRILFAPVPELANDDSKHPMRKLVFFVEHPDINLGPRELSKPIT